MRETDGERSKTVGKEGERMRMVYRKIIIRAVKKRTNNEKWKEGMSEILE